MARIDHTACNHPRTPAGRAACRKGRVSEPEMVPGNTIVPTSDDKKITFKRTGEVVIIWANGLPVGEITKRTVEHQRLIKGTMIRHAKGRMVTSYHITLVRAAFVGMTYDQAVDAFGWSTLTLAKNHAKRMIDQATLKG